jgi:hypothetical protein
MKRIIITLLLILPFSLATLNIYSQCEPATPEQCPDPENNGQVCPDSLVAAFVGQFYSQVATIKPPATYFLPPDSTEITLHHVKLMEVDNLPEGITWQSNTPDSIFIAGEYYCVLLEGTPDSAGEYTLRIVVDVYVLIFGVPVKVATATDSTSLTLVVIDNTGINGNENTSFYTRHNNPNPFQNETRIEYYSEKGGPVTFEVFSLLGERVYAEQLNASRGENFLVFKGQRLPKGSYFYLLRNGNYQSSGMMVRAD